MLFRSKPFPCADEISLPMSKPAPAELLKSRVCLSRGEAKIIGNKLIFKGSANVSLLYRGEDDGLSEEALVQGHRHNLEMCRKYGCEYLLIDGEYRVDLVL